MDERLPLGSLDAPALRMLLEKERREREALTQEVARLRAGLERQNARIITLERENVELRRTVALQAEMIRGLTEQNRGRQRLPADADVRHAVERCPDRGHALAGGWEPRRIQVIEAPPPAPVVVTDHILIRRQCPACGKQVAPRASVVGAERVGQSRLGPRLLAQIATMAIVERLPIRQIQHRLQRTDQFALSLGGVIGALDQVAGQSAGTYAQLHADIRGSPVVHADETGWKEDGIPGYIWTLSTDHQCLFHRDPSRAGAVMDELLGDAFGGVLVTNFYAAYDHLPGRKQRCWAHLWRDIDALETDAPEDTELAA